MKLIRLGVRPSAIDEMTPFERMDLLNLAQVELLIEQKQLARLIANEMRRKR